MNTWNDGTEPHSLEAKLQTAKAHIALLLGIIDEIGLPPKPHEGPCTPESNCDASCMDFASLSTILAEAERFIQ